MPLRRKKNHRLGISTGDDKATGAQSTYRRKLQKQEAKAEAKGKSKEEKRLEEEIFGLDYSNQGDEHNEADVSLDWLGQQRSKKLKLEGVEDTSLARDGEDDELQDLEDHEVRD